MSPPEMTDALPKPAGNGDPWQDLRRHTSARIAQGRSGASLPTAPMLAFQLAHAQARDAVHLPFDADGISALAQKVEENPPLEVLHVRSAAADRSIYLRRPDLGRRLDKASRLRLTQLASPSRPFDFAFVIADGLSALAVHQHALPVFRLVRQALIQTGWNIAPLVIAEQARVALGDEIGELLGAKQLAILIGERPGLSSADSLGIYLTYAPCIGRHDAERNCISNIRPGNGLDYAQAARTLVWLADEARRRQLTGVALKDESEHDPLLVESQVDTGPSE
ncbi:MAG: ethanolamine ammonia-lyase subunit EutC [Rhodocyclales bacterium]|nr:ethanolamine ammonia-lyase subunit EutC [Rhodocyclales bacterium]